MGTPWGSPLALTVEAKKVVELFLIVELWGLLVALMTISSTKPPHRPKAMVKSHQKPKNSEVLFDQGL